MSQLMESASRLAPDRITIAGVLAVRCLRYVNETQTAPSAALPHLRVRSTRATEAPLFHASTGLYGFLGLLPGIHRLIIEDPDQRYLPRAIEVDVPDRSAVRTALERGALPPPGAAGPRYADAAMRPSVSYPLLPGETAIWGQIRDAGGAPVAFCRLQLASRHDDADTTVISYSDADGVYLLRLPGERASFVAPADMDDDGVPDTAGELTSHFDRELVVHALKQDPLALTDPLAAFPADFDSLDPAAAAGPYELQAFSLYHPASTQIRVPDGAVMPQPEIQVGRRTRWDINLT